MLKHLLSICTIVMFCSQIFCQAPQNNQQGQYIESNFRFNEIKITWESPVDLENNVNKKDMLINFKTESFTEIKKISVNVVTRNDTLQLRTLDFQFTPSKKEQLAMNIKRTITLNYGINEIEVIAENKKGEKQYSYRYIYLDAAK